MSHPSNPSARKDTGSCWTCGKPCDVTIQGGKPYYFCSAHKPQD